MELFKKQTDVKPGPLSVLHHDFLRHIKGRPNKQELSTIRTEKLCWPRSDFFRIMFDLTELGYVDINH